MYKNVAGLLSEARERGLMLHDVISDNEASLTGVSKELIYKRLREHFSVMKQSAHAALRESVLCDPSFIGGQSMRQNAYSSGKTLSGSFINRVMAMALSSSEANAGMCRICAAPTAGACGIIPAVIIGVGESLGADEDEMLRSLLVASGFGTIIAKNATISGAEGGCQAECGAAGAMAAAAAVYLSHGTPEMCASALAIALMNCMGLVCDPVCGIVQLPCSFRNASAAVNALICADMALAGQESVIPADEVIEAMYRVGKALPTELRETALGGVAQTPTAKRLESELSKNKYFEKEF